MKQTYNDGLIEWESGGLTGVSLENLLEYQIALEKELKTRRFQVRQIMFGGMDLIHGYDLSLHEAQELLNELRRNADPYTGYYIAE